MKLKRRSLILGLTAAALAPEIVNSGTQAQDKQQAGSPYLNVFISASYRPVSPDKAKVQSGKAASAVMEHIRTAYGDRPLPIWDKNYREAGLEKRVNLVSELVYHAVHENMSIHPTDPCWLLSMVMTESMFCEFAVSAALAVGMSQFASQTAREYGLVTAGSKPEHSRPPYQLNSYAGKLSEYYSLRNEKREFIKNSNYNNNCAVELRNTLEMIISGKKIAGIEDRLNYLKRLDELDGKIYETKHCYKEYLKENFKNRDIFNKEDESFLNGFDERAVPGKAIPAMVKMNAALLKARSGNLLAATCAYNSGLGATADSGIYKSHGRIPGIEETAAYLSRIVVNYQEIIRRLT